MKFFVKTQRHRFSWFWITSFPARLYEILKKKENKMWKRQLWRKVALTKFFFFLYSKKVLFFFHFYFKILFPYSFNRYFDAKILCLYFPKFLDMMVHSLCHRKKSGTNLLLRPRRNQKTTLLWRKFIVLTSHRDAPISTKTFTACTER